MTLEIVVFDGLRSFAFAERTVTFENMKTYECEQKIFKISDRLSSVALVSGNPEISGRKIKDLIDEFIKKTDVEDMKTIGEIKDSFNEFVSKTAEKVEISDYVNFTFSMFKEEIKDILKQSCQEEFLEDMKYNLSENSLEFLDDDESLNHLIFECANKLFDIDGEMELEELMFYLRSAYYNFLIETSMHIVFVGYDEFFENPTYYQYAILCNCDEKLRTMDEYSVHNCNSTMIFTIAQDNDIQLNLTGFDKNSYENIRKIFVELFKKHLGDCDSEVIRVVDEDLKIKLNELKLINLDEIIEYIRLLPDCEILELFDILIQLSSVKMRFSKNPHSIGRKCLKVVLRKYNGVKFIE